ncbi:MAG: hypothetical protein P1U56_08895 [Saprospiraceae bacterium]|nr:hypothetical protein [Saprospiraceae bacterium]
MQGDFSKLESIINAPFLHKGFTGWPSFSPNGDKIAFTNNADQNTCYICIVDINSPSTFVPITNPDLGAKRPSWHPDGSEIAYNVDNQTIWVYHLENKTSQLYLPESVRGNIKLIHPCYAADGKSIFVASLHRGGVQRDEVLYRLIPTNHENIVQITQFPHVCAGRPAASPDHTNVVFAGHAGFFNQVENRLWKTNFEGPSFELEEGDSVSCQGRCPAYSPDGQWVACVSTRPLRNPTEKTPMAVWIIRSDGSESYKLTDSSLLPTHMTWSPDQKKLAVTGAFGLQLIDLPKIFT